MKYRYLVSLSLLSVALAHQANAQTRTTATATKELDIEMTIVDEHDTPAMVINRIELPPANNVLIANENDTSAALETTSETSSVEQQLDDITRSATQTVTETVNDALSSGDLIDLPDDINIPDEVIDDLLNDTGEQIDDLTGNTATDLTKPIDDITLDHDLQTELPDAGIDSALDDLEATMELETLEAVDSVPTDLMQPDIVIDTEVESATYQELDASLPSAPADVIESTPADMVDDAQRELGL